MMSKGPQSNVEVWEEVLIVLLMVSVILHCDITESHKIHVASSDGERLDEAIYTAIGTSVYSNHSFVDLVMYYSAVCEVVI